MSCTQRSSTKPYRNACGMHARNAWLERRQQSVRGGQAAAQVSRVAPVGVNSVDSYLQHIAGATAAFGDGREVWGALACRQKRARVRVLKRRQLERMAQELVLGATSVRGRWSRGRPRTLPEEPAHTVLAWGNASVGHGSCISRSMGPPNKELQDFCRRRFGDRLTILVTDEYCTSQGCPLHYEREHRLKGMREFEGPYRVPRHSHVLRVCQGLAHRSTVLHRDVAASMLIAARALGEVFVYSLTTKLASFQRRPRRR